jgi:hypothetical protein
MVVIERYKKSIEGKTVTFSMQFKHDFRTEDDATLAAVAVILEMTGIPPAKFVTEPVKIYI